MAITTASWSTADKRLTVMGSYSWGNETSATTVQLALSNSNDSSVTLGTVSISAPADTWTITIDNPASVPCAVTVSVGGIVETKAVDNSAPDCLAGTNSPPVAIITPSTDQTINAGDSISFTGDTSFDPDANTTLTYEWHFVGAMMDISSTQANPGPINFPSVDTVTVSLIVKDDAGLASATASITVNVVPIAVNQQPVAVINTTPIDTAGNIAIATGDSVIFSGENSSDPDGNLPLTYEWTFSGTHINTTSTVAKPAPVTFTNEDVVTVSLTVTDSLNLKSIPATVTITITAPPVNQPPQANIISAPAAVANVINIDTGASVDFSSTASDPDGNLPLSYQWTFDGGTPLTSNVANPGMVSFNVAGQYQVSLQVKDSLNLAAPLATVTVIVTDPVVNQPPNGFINSTPAADTNNTITINAGDSIEFSATATDPENDPVTSFTWIFNGGTASTTTGAGPITVTFPTESPASQPYTVEMTATDSLGNTDPTPATVNVVVLPASSTVTKTISFVEINDLHAHLTLHTDLKRVSSGPNAGTAVLVKRGGLARIATKIKEIRMDNPNSIVMNVGDTFHGGVEAFYSAGNDIVQVMNLIDSTPGLGIDVGVPGNWDFVYGPNVTRARFTNDRVIGLTYPILQPTYPNLGANVTSTLQRAGQTLMPSTWSTTIDGVHIGILGITSDIVPLMHPSLATGMSFLQGEAAYKSLINDWAAKLRTGDAMTPPADIVVVMSELGIHKDKRLADIITPDSVDVFFSAHTHELVETAIATTSHALVVEPGNDTYIGRMDIGLDANNNVVTRNWQVIPIEQSIVEDSAVANLITTIRQPYLASSVSLSYPLINSTQTLTQPINTVLTKINDTIARDRSLENSFNNFYTDLLLKTYSSQGVQVAMTPGFRYGAIVPGLNANYEDSTVATGEITIEDVYRFFPVPYTLSIGDITGKNLKFVIDKNLRDVYSTDIFQQQGGWFDGFAGLTMQLNLAQPAQPIENSDGTIGSGTRVQSLTLKTAATPIADTDTIKVVGCSRPFDTNTATTLCSYDNFTNVTPVTGNLTAIDFLTGALTQPGAIMPAPRTDISDSNNTVFWPNSTFIQPLEGVPAP